MKCEKLKDDKKNKKLSFLLSGSNEVFANAIRRLIIEEVPTLAVEEVEIKDNNSALHDEMLALRLGLIPIKTDLKSYRLPKNQDEVTEKSASCTLQLKLKANKKGYVYAEEAESADPKCTFVYEKMPVVKLLSKQKIDVTMTAVMGQGKEHTKWTPGLAHYKKEPVLKVSKIQNPERLASVCSDGVFRIKGNNVEVVAEKVYESKLLDTYAEMDKGISVTHSDNLIFNVEGWGQLSCKEMLTKSADILLEKVEEMEKRL
ncbi:DNA-directed RNA polymerase subunit D [Candidatus Woesearchaeota archaeon]|nr:DNA-directed RNA polymerase subunit D [Candidatus Woesearchaeota archaeon]